MMQKRIVAIILSFILAFGSLPVFPSLTEDINVKADEISVVTDDNNETKKQAPDILKIEVNSNDRSRIDIHSIIGNTEEGSEINVNYGALSIPWNMDTSGINPMLSLNDAKEMLVKDEYTLTQGRIGNEDVEVPAAYPYTYDDEEHLNIYFDTMLPPLRSQGATGTCWAHSVVGALESYMLFNNDIQDVHGTAQRDSKGYNNVLPGINYSELHLAYFTFHTNENPLINGQNIDYIDTYSDEESFVNFGNDIFSAALTLLNWRGVVDESLVPLSDYTKFETYNEKNAKSGLEEQFAFNSDVLHLSEAYYIDSFKNPNQVKQAIQANGAVCTLYLDDDYFYNDKTNAYYYMYPDTINHAVDIVGWDDNFPREYFENEYIDYLVKYYDYNLEELLPKKNGAWLVRNSWLDSLAYPDRDKLVHDGYFWMSYEDKTLCDMLVLEADPADKYDNNYFYTNNMSSVYSERDFDTIANVYTLNGLKGSAKESVDAVAVITNDSNVNYSISICAVDEEGKPDLSRKLNAIDTEGVIVFPGIHTIPLTDPVILSRGEKFAVVVKTLNGNIASEWECYSPDLFRTHCDVNPGESFGYIDSEGWRDYSEYYTGSTVGNFFINVLTSDVEDVQYHSVEGLKCTSRSSDSITIEWESLGKDVKYDIFRGLNSNDLSDFYLIKRDHSQTYYNDSDIPKCSKCYYVIVPVIDYEDEYDLKSNFIGVETKPENYYKVAEKSLITDSYFCKDGIWSLAFGKIGSANGIRVEYSAEGSNEWNRIAWSAADLDEMGYSWVVYENQLDPGLYKFRTKYFYSNIYGETYEGATNETDDYILNYYPAPDNLKYVYDEEKDEVSLSWDPVAFTEVTGYDVFKTDTINDERIYTKVNSSVVTGTAITLTDLPAEQDIEYSVFVHVDKFSYMNNNEYSYRASVVASRLRPTISPSDINIVFPEDLLDDGYYRFYDGYEHGVSVSTDIPTEERGEITVYYREDNSDQWTTELPVDAGLYHVAIDLKGGTKYRTTWKLTDPDWAYYIYSRIIYVTPDENSKYEYSYDPEFTYQFSIREDEQYYDNITEEEKNELLKNIEKEKEYFEFSGSLTRAEGETPGVYSYNLGTLKLKDNEYINRYNYALVVEHKNYFTILPLPVMAAPEVTVVSKTNTSVELSWSADNLALKYAVFADDERICVTSRTACIVKNLEPETEYTFTVYPFRNISNMYNEGEPGSVTVTTEGRKTLQVSDFTFEAPEGLIYNGEACIEPVITSNVDVNVTAIYYKKSNSEVWENEAVDAGTYTVAIDTDQTSDYAATDKLTDESWKITILPTDKKISNTPSDVKIVAFDTDKVSKITLPENWVWDQADIEKELTVGKVLEAKAVYIGADKDNYTNTSITISIIRSVCNHEHTEIINVTEATCKEEGYTGDVYCYECDQIIEKGNEIEVIKHSYGTPSYIWGDNNLTCQGTAKCDNCGYELTEVVDVVSEVLKEATTESKGITRYTATFTKKDVFAVQVLDLTDIPVITEEISNGSESGEETGNESGNGEETGNGSESGEETGNGSESGEETGNESGSGEESGNGSENGEETGNESSSGEEPGNDSVSSDTDSNGENDSGSSSNGGSSSGSDSGSGTSSSSDTNDGSGSSSGSNSSNTGSESSGNNSSSGGSGSSGGSSYNPVIVTPSDNTNNGVTGDNTSDNVNKDDKNDKNGEENNNTGDTTVTGNTTGNTEGTSSNSDKTITKTTKDNDGNSETYVYNIKKASEGTKKADQGIVALKKMSGESVNVTISGIIKKSGKKYVVEAIAKKILYKNKTTETLVIGSNIKTIGAKAFAYNSKLNTIWILSTNLETIGKDAFKKIASTANIYIVTGKKKTFNRIKKLIEDSGIGKNVNIEQKSKKDYEEWKANLSES